MTEADVSRIESALGHPLPGPYRDFLIRHSDEVRRLKDVLEFRAVLWTDADEIIRENLEARQFADAMTIGEDETPWPEDYLVVGTNGGGDYWFVHRDGPDPGLWFWQHEAHEIERHNTDLDAYLAELLDDERNPPEWTVPTG